MDEILALLMVFGFFWFSRFLRSIKGRKKKTVPLSAFNQQVRKQPAPPVSAAPAATVQLGEGASHMVQPLEYTGSLGIDTDEGRDTCDPELEHDRSERIDPHSVYADEIGAEPLLDLSPKGLYQGMVMSEILTRPADRNKRKGASWRN